MSDNSYHMGFINRNEVVAEEPQSEEKLVEGIRKSRRFRNVLAAVAVVGFGVSMGIDATNGDQEVARFRERYEMTEQEKIDADLDYSITDTLEDVLPWLPAMAGIAFGMSAIQVHADIQEKATRTTTSSRSYY